MAATNPKEVFQKFQPDHAKEARQQFPQPWFCAASVASMAQLCREGANTDEMKGAQKFLSILVGIGEPPTPEIQKFPAKTLETLGN